MNTVSTAVKRFSVLSCALVAIYLAWSWNHALHPGEESYFIKPGTGISALAGEMRQRDVLLETKSFVLLAYIMLRGRDVHAGEYQFRNGMNACDILGQVVAGHVVEYPVKFLEGWTFHQMLDELASKPNISHALKGLSAIEIMTRLGVPTVHPEGRFYPDTYFYVGGSSDLAILRRAYIKMQSRLQREWDNRDDDLPLQSPEQALTLASIVEKETGNPAERRLIAGVFINRLKKGIRLQTDPTVIYGMGLKFDGNLRKKDLLTDTPYNSYLRTGLPPTPIAMPGGDALYAAMHPEKTSALYFVSRGDGSHVFSSTLEEHNRAVEKFQLSGRPKP